MVSFPHLLHGDVRYVRSVAGLEPNKSRHELFVILEPISGTPLKGAKRIQFNMFLRPVRNITSLESVRHSLVPMFWIEESFTLPLEYQDLLKNTLFKALWIMDIVKYTVLAIAITIISSCIVLFVYAK